MPTVCLLSTNRLSWQSHPSPGCMFRMICHMTRGPAENNCVDRGGRVNPSVVPRDELARRPRLHHHDAVVEFRNRLFTSHASAREKLRGTALPRLAMIISRYAYATATLEVARAVNLGVFLHLNFTA